MESRSAQTDKDERPGPKSIIVWKRKPDPKARDRLFSARNKNRPRLQARLDLRHLAPAGEEREDEEHGGGEDEAG